jgi:hypothetical protein
MKYIHSNETLNVPEGGEYNCSPVGIGKRIWEVDDIEKILIPNVAWIRGMAC